MHEILACTTEQGQNLILNRFLNSRGLPPYVPATNNEELPVVPTSSGTTTASFQTAVGSDTSKL